MNKAKFISFASVISELQQSDVFMTVKARILETPKANLNGAAVTPAFVDDIIANEERYVGLPLYADVRALKDGRYNRLGHLYDSKTGEFHSTQIGSFYQFEKEEFDEGAYLVGYARIPKRDKKISKAIAELFADGALKFSFEIACGDYEELEDGTFLIDASENNHLEGTAIVTFPACEDAVALEFVAQREADDTERGEKEMAEVEKLEEEQKLEGEQEVVAEATESQPEEAVAEAQETVAEQEPAAEEAVEATAEETAEVTAEEPAAIAEKQTEPAETEPVNAETETAGVVVVETQIDEHHTSVYDTETGKEASIEVTVRTDTREYVDDAELVVEENGNPAVAEADVESAEVQETAAKAEDDDPEEDHEGHDNGCAPTPEDKEKKKTAEELIAELTETVKSLAEEIKSLKEKKQIASIEVNAEAVNPFMDSMQTQGNRYSLLDPVEKPNGRNLLSR